MNEENLIKVILVGEPGVGKKSIYNAFTGKNYDKYDNSPYFPMEVEDKEGNKYKVKFLIDIIDMGEFSYSLDDEELNGTYSVVLVCDLTNKESF